MTLNLQFTDLQFTIALKDAQKYEKCDGCTRVQCGFCVNPFPLNAIIYQYVKYFRLFSMNAAVISLF